MGLLTETTTAEGLRALPFAVSLFTLAPAVCLIGLMALRWKLDDVPDTKLHFDSVGEKVNE